MEYLPILLTAAVIIAVIAGVIWHRRREAERRSEIERLAPSLGFDYLQEDETALQDGFAEARLFTRGRRKKVKNVLRRDDADGKALVFDYQYTVGGGKNSNTYRQTVAAVQIPGRGLPRFELRPEGWLTKLGTSLGYQDIDFDGFPEFSRRYLLRGPEEEAIRAFFGPGILYHLEQNLGWFIEGGGEWVVFYHHAKREQPDDLYTFWQDCLGLSRALR